MVTNREARAQLRRAPTRRTDRAWSPRVPSLGRLDDRARSDLAVHAGWHLLQGPCLYRRPVPARCQQPLGGTDLTEKEIAADLALMNVDVAPVPPSQPTAQDH